MDPEPLTYRPGYSRVCFVLYLVFALWWVVATLVGPHPGGAVGLGAWLTLVGCLLHGLFWRPAVRVDAEGVLVVNVVRDVRLPWSALAGLDTKYALTLTTAAGRRVQSWAAAAPGRPALPGRANAGAALPDPRWSGAGVASDQVSRDLRTDSGAAAFMVEQRWELWREGPGRTVRGEPEAISVHWNRTGLVLAAAALVVAFGSLAGPAGLG